VQYFTSLHFTSVIRSVQYFTSLHVTLHQSYDLRSTLLHFTSLYISHTICAVRHFTSRDFTSVIRSVQYFTSLQFTSLYISHTICAVLHLTSRHFTSVIRSAQYFTSLHVTLHQSYDLRSTSLHFTSLYISHTICAVLHFISVHFTLYQSYDLRSTWHVCYNLLLWLYLLRLPFHAFCCKFEISIACSDIIYVYCAEWALFEQFWALRTTWRCICTWIETPHH